MSWKYTTISFPGLRAGTIYDGDTYVAGIGQLRRGDEEIDRLGRLIEAAPELYALVREVFENGAMNEDAAREALKRAGYRPREKATA